MHHTLLILAAALLLVAGCGPPGVQAGDVYENLLTGERVHVEEVGICDHLRDAKESLRDTLIAREDTSTEAGRRQAALWVQMIGIVRMDTPDAAGHCYTYQTTERSYGLRYPVTHVRPVSELQERTFKRLNG